jgi:hypothetical protein
MFLLGDAVLSASVISVCLYVSRKRRLKNEDRDRAAKEAYEERQQKFALAKGPPDCIMWSPSTGAWHPPNDCGPCIKYVPESTLSDRDHPFSRSA